MHTDNKRLVNRTRLGRSSSHLAMQYTRVSEKSRAPFDIGADDDHYFQSRGMLHIKELTDTDLLNVGGSYGKSKTTYIVSPARHLHAFTSNRKRI